MTHPVSGLSSHLLTKKGLVAKRQWYCQIGPKRRARAETADWRTMHACKTPETAKELPLAETVTKTKINYLIGGGGGSHQRTGLSSNFPC